MVLGSAYLALGQPEKAEAEARKSFDANPNDLEARNLLAVSFMHRWRFDEAVETWQQILKEPGLLPKAEAYSRLQLAVCYYLMLKARTAEREIERSSEIDPTLDPGRGFFASTLAMQWRFGEAKKLLGQAIANPSVPAEMSRLMESPYRTPQWEAGMKATKLRFQRSAHGILAAVYLQMFEPDKAAVELQSAGGGNIPENRTAQLSLLVQQRQFTAAKEFFEAALRQPDTSWVSKQLMRDQLAVMYAETGDTIRARAELDQLLAQEPSFPLAQLRRAYLDTLEGKDLQQAEKMVRQLLEEAPGNLLWQSWLASIIVKRGQPEKGLEMMEKLSTDEVMARNLVFWDMLGDTYLQCKQPEKARAAWQKALTLFPKTTAPDDRRRGQVERKLEALR